jgi:hypothetical protein
MTDPHYLGCLFSGNCDFCKDPNCGPTSERALTRDLTNPLVAQGWKTCENKECEKKFQTNLASYQIMTLKQLKALYPAGIRVQRSNGQIEEDWIIASHLIRYTTDGELFLTVALKNDRGSIKLHKIVPYETFQLWQTKK